MSTPRLTPEECQRLGEIREVPFWRPFLVSPGPRRQQVILRIRETLGLSLRDAKSLVDGGEVLLKDGMDRYECHRLRAALESLGATVRIA